MNRKQRRQIDKQFKKGTAAALEKVENAISNMTKSCAECGVPFDATDKKSLDDWHISVYSDNTVKLICPNCSASSVGT